MATVKSELRAADVTLKRMAGIVATVVALVSGVNYISAQLIAPGIIEDAHGKAKALVEERMRVHDTMERRELEFIYKRLGEIQSDFNARLDRVEAKLNK